MKAFNRSYWSTRDYDDDTYYVFVINGTGSTRSGFMPFKRKFGYIFADNTTDIASTIAHELGHGAFRLRHTFSDESFNVPQGTTDNLMDYNKGTNLKKYQWDGMRSQEAMVSWMEGEEESALTTETFTTQLKNGETNFTANSYQLITATPTMPKISVKGLSSNSNSVTEVSFRLKIEYRRDIRQDEDFFPDTGWKKIQANEKWEIDFGEKIRGGKATLYCDYGTIKDTIIFHIRGTNPSEQSVKDYIVSQNYDDTWFFTRLIRQESNYRHFNPGTNYGPAWTDSQGCPNFGPPHGWGLLQLDLLNGGQRPSAQHLWNWKANVDRGYQFLNGEKRAMVNNRLNAATNILSAWYEKNPEDIVLGHADQVEGLITYTHANSAHFDFNFGSDVSGQNRPFADAAWIKNYNGSSGGTDGYPGFYYLIKQIQNQKPFWDVQRTNNVGHNYVEAVSNRAD
jgi:hypothetical protein